MSCSRGKATPDTTTTYRLFADAAGFCQNPRCVQPLFRDTGGKVIHMAERAHVFAAADDGPRANRELSESERGQYENVILLCPTCHTMVDKAEAQFPAALLIRWKAEHIARIATLFRAADYATRAEVRAAIEPLLQENNAIYNSLNPDLPYQSDPEAEQAVKWQQAVVDRIIPNNRRVLATLDRNREHLLESEKVVLEQFRQHVLDQEVRHLSDVAPGDQQRFPREMTKIVSDV